MCLVVLFYYPSTIINTATNTKTEFALKTWMKDAQKAGYINNNASDIDNILNSQDPDLTLISFDSSIDGALEFYNRLYSVDYPEYNQQTLYCIGKNEYGQTILLNQQINDVARDESFEKYDLGVGECENIINAADYDITGICVSDARVSSTSQNKLKLKSSSLYCFS